MVGDNHSAAPVDALPLRNRFFAALALAGETMASWARSKGHTESLVWMYLSGGALHADMRTDIAAVVDSTPVLVDAESARERAA